MKEVAVLFSVKPATVKTWIKDGKLPAIRLHNSHLRVAESAIRDLAKDRIG